MSSIFETPISIFPNYKSIEGKEVSLYTWLVSPKYAAQVEKIRAIACKAERDRLKAGLPAITPSGLFGQRKEEGLIRHSGFIQFDIDLKENKHIKNYDKLKAEICNIKEVAYLGLSVSGQGYWGLIRIACPDKHKWHFRALEKDFFSLGITIDPAPSSVASLRGYSFDKEAYFNFNPLTYETLLEERPREAVRKPEKIYSAQACPSSNVTDRDKVEFCIQAIEEGRIDITSGYSNWYALGTALAMEFGESGRTYFHQVSQFNSEYRPSETDTQFDKCLKKGKGYSLGTFFQMCIDYGITYKEALSKAKPKPKEEKLVPASPESLPASFTFFNKTLEYNGLPWGWLNEEEAIQAHKELEGFELEVMKKVNPAVGYLVDKLGLKAEEVVRHPSPSRTRSNKEETTFVLNISQSREEVKELQSQGRYVYCGRTKGKVSNEGTGFWGNPFPEKLFGLKECIKLHKEWLHNGEEANTKLAEAGSSELIGKGSERLKRVSELKGKALGCYCKPKACHCDYLAELANTS